jgi:hypothetical protein
MVDAASSKNEIGSRNESSLHSAIKNWYARPGDKLEEKVDNFVVDIVRDGLVIEIQTKNFYAIRQKLQKLVENHNLRLVYPIPKVKWITKVAKFGGKVISKRRSPRKGHITDLFNELLRIPELINHENFSVEVLMIEEDEIRCADGKGSWRRKGVSIRDRKLLGVVEQVRFTNRQDFLKLLPENLSRPFSNKNLAKALGIPLYRARRTNYCLRKMGALKVVGKKGNELQFDEALSVG